MKTANCFTASCDGGCRVICRSSVDIMTLPIVRLRDGCFSLRSFGSIDLDNESALRTIIEVEGPNVQGQRNRKLKARCLCAGPWLRPTKLREPRQKIPGYLSKEVAVGVARKNMKLYSVLRTAVTYLFLGLRDSAHCFCSLLPVIFYRPISEMSWRRRGAVLYALGMRYLTSYGSSESRR